MNMRLYGAFISVETTEGEGRSDSALLRMTKQSLKWND